MIHPTAIIDPTARLGTNVRVGAYALVEAGAEIGDDCEIQAHAVIGGHVRMGRGNFIGYGAILGADPQDFSFVPTVKSEVRIGDRNKIREYCTIHRGSKDGGMTSVGDDCFLMGGVHLAHDVKVGNNAVIANNSLLAGHVHVEDRVFIGGGCVFHQFVRIGRLAICQGSAAFGKDIPPFTTGAEINGIAGLNVVGLRRAGFTAEERKEVKEAFTLLFLSGLNVSQALEESTKRTWGEKTQPFWNFVASAKKRGLCALLRTNTQQNDE